MRLPEDQIEKEEQADPKKEVTKEDFQVNGWPQLMDSLLPDPPAHAQAGQPAWSILKISSYFLLTSIIAIGKSAVILLVPPLIQVSSI